MSAVSIAHYKWLVCARSRNQNLLVELLEFGEQNATTLPKKTPLQSVFVLLVGTAFSLWRAAFLTEADLGWPANIKAANELLELVLRTNAITFSQDLAKANWMVGYYLNNAGFRLVRARQWLGEALIPNPEPAELRQVSEMYAPGVEAFSDKAPDQSWDTLQSACEQVFAVLKKAIQAQNAGLDPTGLAP